MIAHLGHALRQEGRCVYCATCNVRLFQGQLPKDPERTARALEEIRQVLEEVAADRERVRHCTHAIVLDLLQGDGHRWRRCWLCGHAYDRTELLQRLERDIRDRYRLPPSPWSAGERAEDCS